MVNPLAVEAMREAGVDISQQRSKNVTEYLGQHFPVIITVCDNAAKNCPIFPGPALRLHWPFQDPAEATGTPEERIAAFRKVRDEISLRIQSWIAERQFPAN